MKNIILAIILIAILNICYSQQLSLSTTNNQSHFFQGDTIHYSLKIIDEDNSTVFTAWNSIFKDLPAPEKHFSVVAKEIGIMKIGPYSISTSKKTIKSGILSFEIRDNNLKGEKIFIEAPDSVKIDERFNINFICLVEPFGDITLLKRESLLIGNSSTHSQMQIVNGVTSQKYSKIFEVAFSEKGEYLIDESWIEGKSDFLELVPFKIVAY